MENKKVEEIRDDEPKVAVRCKTCHKILVFKSGTASGFLQIKCPLCKSIVRVDLSMRRGRIYNRQAQTPLTLTFPSH